MEYQKFIPEGWYETKEEYSLDSLKNAFSSGKIVADINEIIEADDEKERNG